MAARPRSAKPKGKDIKSERFIGSTVYDAENEQIKTEDIQSCEQIGILFVAKSCSICGRFLRVLEQVYAAINRRSKRFEVLMVSQEDSKEEFNKFAASFPWLHLSFGKTTAAIRNCGVTEIPALVLVYGDTLQMVSEKGVALVARDPTGHDFPWAAPSIGDLMGRNNFVTRKGPVELPGLAVATSSAAYTSQMTAAEDGEQNGEALTSPLDQSDGHVPKQNRNSILFHGKTVGLLFGAHWSLFFRTFVRRLKNQYKKLISHGQAFEVVYVSGDHTREDFETALKSMPWMAVSYDEEAQRRRLFSFFGGSEMPSLMMLKCHAPKLNSVGYPVTGPDGQPTQPRWEVLTENAVNVAFASKDVHRFPWRLPKLSNVNQVQDGLDIFVSLIALMEASPRTQLQRVESAMKEAATKQRARGLGQCPYRFFIALEEGEVSEQLRHWCQLGPPRSSPVLLIFDGINRQYNVSTVDWTERDLAIIVQQFENGLLELTATNPIPPKIDDDGDDPTMGLGGLGTLSES